MWHIYHVQLQEVIRGGHVYKGRGRPKGSSLANRATVGGYVTLPFIISIVLGLKNTL